MQHRYHDHQRRPGVSGAARDIAALAFVAFEALAERQYSAPWATPSRPNPQEC